MTYPFDVTALATPGVVDMPEPSLRVQREQIRVIQQEVIAEDPYTYFGASTVQYGAEAYTYEPGIGTLHFNAATASLIGADLATTLRGLYQEFPLAPPITGQPDDYWLIGQLWPDPEDDTSQPVNSATMDFFHRFFALLKERKFEYVNSVAYEILEFFHPPEWQQLNFDGLAGLSGWYPPSAFIQPTNKFALDYIGRVQIQLVQAAIQAGLAPKFQIGEPWWWDGSYSTGIYKNAPCFYDQKTMAMYKAETGNDVPLPYITSIFNPVSPNQWPFIDWLCTKLGDSTNYIRDKVKGAIPNAEATLLFFTPQIMSPNSELTRRVNFPIAEWVYPNYEFVQIEDYDWIIDGRLDLVPQTFKAATEILGYPLEVVHYFIGFVLLAENSYIWDSADKAIGLALEAKIPHLYLWAYSQVMRDNVIFK
uniref:Capsid and scaffold protein n=1 Tax=Pseudomonas phage Arace01 TaxID=3138526 RepID=A0AAU6W045_9VIRU